VSNKFKYQCISCSKEFPEEGIRYLCPNCSSGNTTSEPPRGILKVLYNYESIREKHKGIKELKSNQWLDLLPITRNDSLPDLQVGNTPLYRINQLNNEILVFDLFLKDDSQNPTFSFKDRASGIVSAFAKENGLETIVAASTGNAGSSIAGVAAAQRQKAIVLVPASAPIAKLTQIIMYGATIIPVKGTYDDAFDLSVKATEKYGWYNRNTAYNPLTIEGKKTVSFELFNQLDENIPDRIFVPVGDGVIISGVYKGFEDLLELGFIDQMPTIVAVQSSGSDNLVRNIATSVFEMKTSNTIADSIAVDFPRNYYMAKNYIQKYSGEWITVSDVDIIEASQSLSSNTGLFAEPAAAAAFAGMLKYKSENKIVEGTKNVVLLTGSGLKDIKVLEQDIHIPDAIEPDISSI